MCPPFPRPPALVAKGIRGSLRANRSVVGSVESNWDQNRAPGGGCLHPSSVCSHAHVALGGRDPGSPGSGLGQQPPRLSTGPAGWGGVGRPPPREPRVSERNFLSPSLQAVRGSRRVFLVRGSQLAHCAPARPIRAVLFLPALSLRGRKQTRQRSEAPVHTCAGGEMSGAAPPSKQSQIKQCHPPPERHLVPRAPRGAVPPGSPLLRRRNLMQTHFDHGFLAGLDLPTEKF